MLFELVHILYFVTGPVVDLGSRIDIRSAADRTRLWLGDVQLTDKVVVCAEIIIDVYEKLVVEQDAFITCFKRVDMLRLDIVVRALRQQTRFLLYCIRLADAAAIVEVGIHRVLKGRHRRVDIRVLKRLGMLGYHRQPAKPADAAVVDIGETFEEGREAVAVLERNAEIMLYRGRIYGCDAWVQLRAEILRFIRA